MAQLYATIESPLGELLILSDGEAITGLYLPDHRGGPQVEATWRRASEPFREAQRQLTAYFAGELTTFDLPVEMTGTRFERRVWQQLATIPYGETISYSQLAQQLGQPTATRAVGRANGRNPISIIIPCHRVIGADGNLTGYGGGVERKRWLLELEGRVRKRLLRLEVMTR